jgi:hypothetical protein
VNLRRNAARASNWSLVKGPDLIIHCLDAGLWLPVSLAAGILLTAFGAAGRLVCGPVTADSSHHTTPGAANRTSGSEAEKP